MRLKDKRILLSKFIIPKTKTIKLLITVTEMVKLFEIYQIFRCLDTCNLLPVSITAIFMAYTYYSYNCLILNLRTDSALFSCDLTATASL